MKKILFILATAAIVASCSDVETLKKDIQTSNDEVISFTSYSQPITRAENSTNDEVWEFVAHHTSFEVWGYKNTSNTAVFNGDKVTVTKSGNTTSYTYNDARYWDKAATKYEFYAAAPQIASSGEGDKNVWTFTAPTAQDQNDGYFKTTSTLVGTNLQASTPSKDLVNSFKDANGDIDKMIASPSSVKKAEFGQKVQLHFNHILSKLNISIKKAENIKDETVKIISFTVCNLKAKGDFNENSHYAERDGNNSRWTISENPGTVTYAAKNNWTVDNGVGIENNSNYKFIIESLIIPQDADYEVVALDGQAHDAVLYTTEEYNTLNNTNLENLDNVDITQKTKIAAINEVGANSKPYFVLIYTIGNEEFKAYYNLANAFGMDGTSNKTKIAFNEGWQNTLNILLNPAKIEFDADIYEWATKTATPDLTVE